MNGSLRFGPPSLNRMDCTGCGSKEQLFVKGRCNSCGYTPKTSTWRKTDFCRDRPAGTWESKR